MEGNGLLLDFATIFRIHLSSLKNKDNFEKNSDRDPILRQKMVEESLARLLQSLNFHETVSSDLVFDCITKIIAKQVGLSCSPYPLTNSKTTKKKFTICRSFGTSYEDCLILTLFTHYSSKTNLNLKMILSNH